MPEILTYPSPTSSSGSCIRLPCSNIDGLSPHHNSLSVSLNNDHSNSITTSSRSRRNCREEVEGDHQLPALTAIFRKSYSLVSGAEGQRKWLGMEIGSPTNVRHVAHVTFDRFNGFLGLPVEFEPQVPRRPPSASTRVFGVSTESMQLSFDCRGNCVPTILLMMQRRLYSQRGLQSEGIFRINPGNGQEEYVREQLNNGFIPDDIDVHCLAGLIKAWFRELPRGILDALLPEQVMQAQSEDECTHLARLLPPTESALLDWAINLMADVAQFEHLNKMNARNIAMVFAPNMTQMSDPLTALMYAVQVMNFLKTLIVKALREREDSIVEACPVMQLEPSEEEETSESKEQPSYQAEPNTDNEALAFPTCTKNMITSRMKEIVEGGTTHSRIQRTESSQPRNLKHLKKGLIKHTPQPEIHSHRDDEAAAAAEKKKKQVSIIRRANSYAEPRAEAWR